MVTTVNLPEKIRELRLQHIKWALEQTRGRQRQAAKLINLTSPTFDRWMRELNLETYARQLREAQPWYVRRIYGDK